MMELSRFHRTIGYARSALIYANPLRQPALRRFYRPFIRPGDTVFDIGAHFGDRSLAFAALGAQVIAIEPQPVARRVLNWRLRRYSATQILGQAIGPEPGIAQLAVSDRHPTLATLSTQWREGLAQKDPGFAHVQWNQQIEVEVTTLDALIERFGVPIFCKIDVEGFEAEVLAGLSQPIHSLSFEYLAGAEPITQRCLDQLESLGRYEYNVTVGERRRLELNRWCDASEIRQWLAEHTHRAGSGDVYARVARN